MGIANKTDLNNRVEALEKSEGSGTSNYNQLTNRPKINNNLLTGNKTSNQLGLASSADIASEFSDLTNYNKGDLVYYEGSLYQFQVDHTAGAWESSEAIQKDLSDILSTPRGYKDIAVFTGDGVKTFSDALDELIPYNSQADLFIDGENIFYPRNEIVYTAINIGSTGLFTLYGVRFDVGNKYFKTLILPSGPEGNLLENVVAEGRVLKLCKRL